MFHKVKAVNALPDYRLSVQFAEGVTKIYDVKPLFAKWAPFKSLENAPELLPLEPQSESELPPQSPP